MNSELSLASTPEAQAACYRRVDDSLLRSVAWLCGHYGLHKTDEALLAGLPRATLLSPSLALTALHSAGITGGLVQRSLHEIPVQVLPVLLMRKEAGGCVLLARRQLQGPEGKKDWRYQIIFPEISKEPVELMQDEMAELYAGYAILARPRARLEENDGDIQPGVQGHWLFSILWRYRRYYRSAALGAVLINVLALASIFFTMNVYDRVIPNQAFVTLWSLAAGVSIAMVFEAVTRFVRAHLLDVAGKKTDLVVGDLLFRQALSVQMEHKPTSTGAFANQLREFEAVREFIASATLAALTDLPFVLLFVAVIFAVGGWLGFIPLLMIPLIILISLAVQWPLARTMKENLAESSQKQGVLIESVEGMEALKSTRGEAWMQRRWKNFSALQSASAMKSKRYSAIATGSVALLQQLQTVILIVAGVYLIDSGNLTMGALIASVMLSGRATAPLSQVVALAVRFQQARSALCSLGALMALPVDRPAGYQYLPAPDLRGDVVLKDVDFTYPASPAQPAPKVLHAVSLSVRPGERVAVLGTIGSGKSSLLRIIARLFRPVSGQIFSGDIDVCQIDPADWRKAVSYVPQQTRLFSGTLRDNIMLGCPEATPGELLRVLRLTGLDKVVAAHPAGIHLPVGEGGDALSGGQRQLVALARCLLNNPAMLLLDEPTSAMDTQTEQQFMNRLASAIGEKTLIIVTHRLSLLKLVDRLVVMEEGKIIADGPKDIILKQLGVTFETAAPADTVDRKRASQKIRVTPRTVHPPRQGTTS